MRYLFTLQRTWVLSRLCIEMEDMPEQYSHFTMETWVESAMKYFTKRNFCLTDDSTGKVYGYGRSIWALIDLTTRQPLDILEDLNDRIKNFDRKVSKIKKNTCVNRKKYSFCKILY